MKTIEEIEEITTHRIMRQRILKHVMETNIGEIPVEIMELFIKYSQLLKDEGI
jgi:hypothetical protein